jgi:hypothetical protein
MREMFYSYWKFFLQDVGRNNYSLLPTIKSRGSSVSIVSDYGLDDWGSIPGRGKGYFF